MPLARQQPVEFVPVEHTDFIFLVSPEWVGYAAVFMVAALGTWYYRRRRRRRQPPAP